MFNQSGMHKVAETLMEAERKLGLDSCLVNMHETDGEQLETISDSDVFVAHTHFPNEIKKRATKDYKLVFPVHGTIEYIFNSALVDGKMGYGHGDGWMLFMHWLKKADAIVTFWPRHQAIIKSMCDKNTKVNLAPLGIDKEFWSSGKSKGKFSGNPSVWTSENCHSIKAPFDLFIAWPWVYEEIPDACLHANYLPTDLHRWYMPLVNRNGASYGSHISPLTFAQDELRCMFKSIDFFCGLVRYGDYNRLCLEANVAGATTISYRGNEYSDYWITEGDQRQIATELIAILKKEVEPRQKTPVPDASEMAQSFKEIYESIL